MTTTAPQIISTAFAENSARNPSLTAHIPHTCCLRRYESSQSLPVWLGEGAPGTQHAVYIEPDYCRSLTSAIDHECKDAAMVNLISNNPGFFTRYMLAGTLSSFFVDWLTHTVRRRDCTNPISLPVELKITIADRYCAEYICESISRTANAAIRQQALDLIKNATAALESDLVASTSSIGLSPNDIGFSAQQSNQISKALQYLSAQPTDPVVGRMKPRVTSRLTKSGCDYLIHVKAKLFY